MAYFEALEEAVALDMVEGHRSVPSLIQSILGDVSEKVAQSIADCAEIIAETTDQRKIDAALIDVGKLGIGAIYQYLSDNHPNAWGDEGDLSEYEEKLRIDRKERTRDMQLESARIYSYTELSQEK